MSTKIDDAFTTLRNLIADTPRDLAMAMAELRSVAAERDKAVTSLTAAGFTLADGAERWKPPVNERMGELYRRLFVLMDERDNLSEALERNCVQYVQKQQALIAERDKLRAAHQIAVAGWNAATIERDRARQSLRAAEADAAETESVNSDLRTVNARLVADLAAAVQRADTAEAILRAKA